MNLQAFSCIRPVAKAPRLTAEPRARLRSHSNPSITNAYPISSLGTQHPAGVIDELEIFDYVLTDDQIYLTKGACKLPEEPSPEVDVDIKPGSDDNPINLGTGSGKGGKNSRKSGKGNANIPVAILTTNDFDEVNVIIKENNTLQAALEDVDDDGDMDLVMHFSIADLVTSEDLNENTVELCVNGETFGGDAIHDCDSVTIVGKGDDDD